MNTPSRFVHVRRILHPLVVLALVGFLAGCALMEGPNHTRHATSLMQFLYPGQTGRTQSPSIPTLTLPLRVGIAFVPDATQRDRSAPHVDRLSETFKATLAREVSQHFQALPFVKAIEIVPTAYLQPAGGFPSLDQIRQLFGVDIMVLLSFDQSQSQDSSILSLTYWTLVGAYVIPAEKNTTATLLDAAVFDIPSRKLLFRAPGLSHVPGRSTPVNASEALREDAQRGFQIASTNLVQNLKTELAAFQERIRQQPDEVKIVRSPGYRAAAGSFEGIFLVLLGLLTFVNARSHHRRP